MEYISGNFGASEEVMFKQIGANRGRVRKVCHVGSKCERGRVTGDMTGPRLSGLVGQRDCRGLTLLEGSYDCNLLYESPIADVKLNGRSTEVFLSGKGFPE